MSFFKKVVSFFVSFWNAIARKQAVNEKTKQKRTAVKTGGRKSKGTERSQKQVVPSEEANLPTDDKPGIHLDEIEAKRKQLNDDGLPDLATQNLRTSAKVETLSSLDHENVQIGDNSNRLTDVLSSGDVYDDEKREDFEVIEKNDILLDGHLAVEELAINLNCTVLSEVDDALSTEIASTAKDILCEAEQSERELPLVASDDHGSDYCDVRKTSDHTVHVVQFEVCEESEQSDTFTNLGSLQEHSLTEYVGPVVPSSSRVVPDETPTELTSAIGSSTSELQASISTLQLVGIMPRNDFSTGVHTSCPSNFSVSSDSLVNFLYCSELSDKNNADFFNSVEDQSCLEEIMCTSKGILKLSDSGVNPDQYYPLDPCTDEIQVDDTIILYSEDLNETYVVEDESLTELSHICSDEYKLLDISLESSTNCLQSIPKYCASETDALVPDCANDQPQVESLLLEPTLFHESQTSFSRLPDIQELHDEVTDIHEVQFSPDDINYCQWVNYELNQNCETPSQLSSVASYTNENEQHFATTGYSKFQDHLNCPSSWRVFTPESRSGLSGDVPSNTQNENPPEELVGIALPREMNFLGVSNDQQSITNSFPDEPFFGSIEARALTFTDDLTGANDPHDPQSEGTFDGMLDTYLTPNEFSEFYPTADGGSLFSAERAAPKKEECFNPCVGTPSSPRPSPRSSIVNYSNEGRVCEESNSIVSQAGLSSLPANCMNELALADVTTDLVNISEQTPANYDSTVRYFRGTDYESQNNTTCNPYNYGLMNLYSDMMFPMLSVPSFPPYLFNVCPSSIQTAEDEADDSNLLLPLPAPWLGYQLSECSDDHDSLENEPSSLVGYRQSTDFDGDGDRSFYDDESLMPEELYFRVDENSSTSLPIRNMLGYSASMFCESLRSASSSHNIDMDSPSNSSGSVNYLNVPLTSTVENAPNDSVQPTSVDGNLSNPEDYSVTEKFMNDVNSALNESMLDQLHKQFRDRGDGEAGTSGDVEPSQQGNKAMATVLSCDNTVTGPTNSYSKECLHECDGDSQSCDERLCEGLVGNVVENAISSSILNDDAPLGRASSTSPVLLEQQDFYLHNSSVLPENREVDIVLQHVTIPDDNYNPMSPQAGCSYRSMAFQERLVNDAMEAQSSNLSEEDANNDLDHTAKKRKIPAAFPTVGALNVDQPLGTEQPRKNKRNRRRKKKSSSAINGAEMPNQQTAANEGTGDGSQILQLVYGTKTENDYKANSRNEAGQSSDITERVPNEDDGGTREDGLMENDGELRSSIDSSNAKRKRNRRRNKKN